MIIFRELFLMFFGVPIDDKTSPIKVGNENMIGAQAKVIEWDQTKGKIEFEGEIWNAESKQEIDLNRSNLVTISEVNKLTLQIENLR